MKKKPEVETITVPHEYMGFADRRIAAIVRRCCYDQNIVESISRSCYLQGVMDGVQLASQRPEVREVMDEKHKDRMLQFFEYRHLPPELQEASKPFCELASNIVMRYPMNPERTVCLRKLLEAKDAAVRTLLYTEQS